MSPEPRPAAIILEVVQGEGGLNCATRDWLVKIEELAKKTGALLIVDDIQAGCGRTGSFFSFEKMNINPDIVVLSKSISGLGLPMSLVLIKPMFDEWSPGEHNGTYRGNNHAFVTANAAIENFWKDTTFENQITRSSELLKLGLSNIATKHDLTIRGTGMMRGIEIGCKKLAQKVVSSCFDAKLIIETCGPYGSILKCMPALTISDRNLTDSLEIIGQRIRQHLK